MSLTLIVQDDQTGETWEEHVADDDYLVLTHGRCEITSAAVYRKSGTHQLTIKRGTPT